MKYILLLFILHLWIISWSQQTRTYPFPMDLCSLTSQDTASFYLCDNYQVKLLFSSKGRVREMYFTGTENLVQREQQFDFGRIISHFNALGDRTGPEISLDRNNKLICVANYYNEAQNGWIYYYYKNIGRLKEINLYYNGVRNPCVIVWDKKGDLFIDNCLLKDGLFRCL